MITAATRSSDQIQTSSLFRFFSLFFAFHVVFSYSYNNMTCKRRKKHLHIELQIRKIPLWLLNMYFPHSVVIACLNSQWMWSRSVITCGLCVDAWAIKLQIDGVKCLWNVRYAQHGDERCCYDLSDHVACGGERSAGLWGRSSHRSGLCAAFNPVPAFHQLQPVFVRFFLLLFFSPIDMF